VKCGHCRTFTSRLETGPERTVVNEIYLIHYLVRRRNVHRLRNNKPQIAISRSWRQSAAPAVIGLINHRRRGGHASLHTAEHSYRSPSLRPPLSARPGREQPDELSVRQRASSADFRRRRRRHRHHHRRQTDQTQLVSATDSSDILPSPNTNMIPLNIRSCVRSSCLPIMPVIRPR